MLIVVVGILAILSLLAATFGVVARIELAVSRNQTEYEMAREAANAGAEYLLSALQSWCNGAATTSGPLPDFLPNSADTDGTLLYRRDGMKVYMAVSSTVPTGSMTPDWLQGVGLQDAGMFNLNAMGFANDLGSNCNPDIRYTSFDCSLVRLLASRFAAVNSTDASTIDYIRNGHTGAPYAPYQSFFDPNERQRMAILLSRAIIAWRHGAPPTGYTTAMPGIPGQEERRLGHLPYWNSMIGWNTSTQPPQPNNPNDTGISPNPNLSNGSYLPSTTAWGTEDGFPSRFIMTCLNQDALAGILPGLNAPNLAMCWTYTEPALWTSYTAAPTSPWNNDIGLPTPGLFWGKMASYSAPVLAADVTQPGWRDWPTGIWNNQLIPPQYSYYVYIATGPCKWQMAAISASGTTSLTLATALAGTPNPGDAFCICPMSPFQQTQPLATFTPGQYVGLLWKRWATPAYPSSYGYAEGDLIPNAMLWPNGTLATEGNVYNLVLDSGIVSDAENQAGGITIMADTDAVPPKNWTPAWQSQVNPNNLPMVVHIYGGIGRGQVRTITGFAPASIGTGYQVTLSAPWTIGNIPMTLWIPPTPNPWTTTNPCLYRIELLDNNLPSKFQPNNLQGNNRLYLTLGDLRDSVIVPALGQGPTNDGLPADNLSTANAQAVANILMPYFLPYLTVSTQAIQASQSLCSINDWGVDGVDNNADGVVDDPGEAQYELSSPQGNSSRAFLANKLYNGLGLYTWAHADTDATVTATRVQQAAQLVANIIDFRDPTDVPTEINVRTLDPAAPTTISSTVNVFGAKGLHVTQVMPSPDAVYSTNNGTEMVNDGQTAYPNPPAPGYLTDAKDWDWNGTAWVDNWSPDNNPVATFNFPGLKPGFYAMRLIGTPNQLFTVTYPPTTTTTTGTPYYAYPTITDPENSTWSTGFVRKYNASTNGPPNNPLACFQVPAPPAANAGTLSFQLQAPSGAQFRGFALCAQYIQLTNISTHDIRLDSMNVTTDQGPIISASVPLPANYTRAGPASEPPYGGDAVDLRRIPGAAVGTLGIVSDSTPPPTQTSATYPINYGTYVICMSEESYEKQWSAQPGDPDYSTNPGYNNAPSTNGDGIWGDERNESYPIYPFGDLSSDAQTMALLLGQKGTASAYQPWVTVKDAWGNLIAGGSAASGYVDAEIPTILNPSDATDSNCYSAIEKTMVLQPTWDVDTDSVSTNRYWRLYTSPSLPQGPVALAASQNTLVIGQDDPPRTPTGVAFRACLNESYGYNFVTNLYDCVWDWHPAAVPKWNQTRATWPGGVPSPMWYTNERWATLMRPSDMVTDPVTADPQNRVFPFILNRPYPTTGWLGLVPTSNTDAINVTAAGLPANTHLPSAPPPLASNFPQPIPSTYLVPPGSWRTIDPNPWPSTGSGSSMQSYPAMFPEQLLGTLMSNATAGGVYARFNINTAPVDALKTVFPDTTANLIVATRAARIQGVSFTPPPANAYALANASWTNWDEFLNDPLFQNVISGQATAGTANTLTAEAFRNWVPGSLSGMGMVVTLTGGTGAGQSALILGNTANMLTISNVFNTGTLSYPTPAQSFSPVPDSTTTYQIGIGFFDDVGSNISNADAGAGTYADGFPDNSNEKKEWFMRFSNLFSMQSTAFQFTVAGLVFKDQPWDPTAMLNNEPVAIVRIEMSVDLSTGTPSIVHFRYLTQ